MNGLSGCKYVLLGGAKIQKGYNCGVHDFLSLDKDLFIEKFTRHSSVDNDFWVKSMKKKS